MAYRDIILADSPLYYFKLDDASATNEVSGGATATLTGTPGLATGIPAGGQGWNLNQNAVISLGGTSNDFTSDNTFAVEGWFKTGPVTANDYPTIWRRDGNGKTVLLRLRGANVASPGLLEVYLNGTSVYTPSRYDDNKWHHVVLSVSATGSTGAKLYVDGILTNTFNNPGSLTLSSATGATHIMAGGGTAVNNGEAFVGQLDEMALYTNSLSQAQVTTHFKAGALNAFGTALQSYTIPYYFSMLNNSNLGSAGGALVAGSGATFGAASVTNKADTAVTLDNTANGYLRMTDITNVWSSSYTVGMWFKTTDSNSTLFWHKNAPYPSMSVDSSGKLTFVADDGQRATIAMTSTASVNDGQWHFAVATVNRSSTPRTVLYLDGVQVGSTNVLPATSTSGDFEIGDSRSSFALGGTVDEFFISSSVFSQSIVQSLMTSVTTSVTAAGVTAATSTAIAPSPVINTNSTVSLISSAAWKNGSSLQSGYNIAYPTNPQYVQSSSLAFPTGQISQAFLRLGAPGSSPEGFMSPTFSYTVYRITSSWVQTTGSAVPTVSDTGYHYTVSRGTDPYVNLPIDGVVAEWKAGAPNYGLSIVVDDTSSFIVPGSYTPRIVMASTPDVTAPGGPASGSGLFVDPSVAGVRNISTGAGVSTASGYLADPVVTVQINANVPGGPASGSALFVQPTVAATVTPDVLFAASPATGSATMPGGKFTAPANTSAGVATASALMTDVTVTKELNGFYKAQPLSGTGLMKDPIQGILTPDRDPWYQRIAASSDYDDVWLRFDAGAGNTLRIRNGGAVEGTDIIPPVTLTGNFAWITDAPLNRNAVHIENLPIKTLIDDADTQLIGTYEFLIRTTQANSLLAYGTDSLNITGSPAGAAVFIRDGRIVLRNAYGNDLVGVKRVDDGQWHHIVISSRQGNVVQDSPAARADYLNSGMRIFIDGTLDRRVTFSNFAAMTRKPDYWFGIPQSDLPFVGSYQKELFGQGAPNFKGDVVSFIYRESYGLDEWTITQLYYDAMGITPVRVEPAGAVGAMGQGSSAKGNRPRILMLRSGVMSLGTGYNTYLESDPFGVNEQQSGTPWKLLAGMDMDFADYTDFTRRDPITDEPRMLDLTKDFDLSYYDMVGFLDWPDTGKETDNYLRYFSPTQIDNFLESVRSAVRDYGVSLWVSNPTLANRLGLITTYEQVSGLRDLPSAYKTADTLAYVYGNDARSKAIDPWENLPTGSYNRPVETYIDTHRNNRQRVVANVPGLTDIPVTFVKDAIVWESTQLIREGGSRKSSIQYGYAPNGLHVGDEMIDVVDFVNNDRGELISTSLLSVTSTYLDKTYAVPPGGLVGGTPVVQFGATYYKGNVETVNPYKDYTGIAVWQPGDSIMGKKIKGKVLLTLSEAPWFPSSDLTDVFREQVIGDTIPVGAPTETAETRKYQWSNNRLTYATGYDSNVDPTGDLLNKLAQLINGGIKQTEDGPYWTKARGDGGLRPPSVSSFYATKAPDLPVLTWVQRGLLWLVTKTERDPLAYTYADPATATGFMPNPVVVAQKSTVVGAQAAVAIGVMANPVGLGNKDVNVLALPATATGVMNGIGKTVFADPATATGDMPFNTTMVRTELVTISMFIETDEVTLYLKEGV